MKRLILSLAVAAAGLALLAVSQTRAEAGPSRGHGHPDSVGGSHRDFGHFEHGYGHGSYRGFRASERFDYRTHGFKSMHWSRYRYSSYYHGYCYWAPSYGWCFYEPSYGYYLPVTYYREVYPEAAPTFATAVSPSPEVVQQTTVVVAPTTPVAPAVEPGPLPEPVVTPAPTAVQQTKVGAGVP